MKHNWSIIFNLKIHCNPNFIEKSGMGFSWTVLWLLFIYETFSDSHAWKNDHLFISVINTPATVLLKTLILLLQCVDFLQMALSAYVIIFQYCILLRQSITSHSALSEQWSIYVLQIFMSGVLVLNLRAPITFWNSLLYQVILLYKAITEGKTVSLFITCYHQKSWKYNRKQCLFEHSSR